jgi:hypothetical protein
MAQATEASPLSVTTSFRGLVGFLGTSHFWPQILAGPKSLIGDKIGVEARHLECPLM